MFPKLAKKKFTEVQEVKSVANEMNPKRSIPGHIIIKMKKFNDK